MIIMRVIQNDDKKVIVLHKEKITEQFIIALNDIVAFYSVKENKIRIDNKTIEIATNLGMYGKTVTQRRYSVYFCSSILQINNTINNDLRNRFMILASDTDRNVRLELSYHIRFLIKEMDNNYIRKNLLKIVYIYLNHN